MMKPTHLAICWDMGVHTFRNDLFDGYKANRPSPPDELKPQFDMAKEVSEMIGWKNFGEVGMEADDTIGSIVEKWKNDAKITVVSGDKDLLQLLNPSTTIALTKKVIQNTMFMMFNVLRKNMQLHLHYLQMLKHLWAIQVMVTQVLKELALKLH